MADIKVSEMSLAESIQPDDLFMIVGGSNKRITASNVLKQCVVVSSSEPQNYNRKSIWFQQGKNKFNKNDNIVNGYYISGDGSIVSSVGSWYQNSYIDVSPSMEYTISSNLSIFRIAFYDVNFNFLSRIAQEKNEITFSTPANCYYVRISGIDGQLDTVQLEYGAKSSYEAYIYPCIYVLNDNNIYEQFMRKNLQLKN